ncbi:hypothetical protein JTE90_008910 [Oedothorax gibbosus]|uniref:Enkurin domain-containing protein n=1 Tax=Oedothorax gibbosus TaxID=931172 RepID=A0AAV6UJZ7_9ARAC|nr:hypothetical protein JTE90_008910 [Oedothorax gibbosus]
MTEFQKILISKKFKEIEPHTENIYNLVPISTNEQTKRTLKYESIYSNLTKAFYESIKKPHQTMGYAEVSLKPPQEFLKKHTRETRPRPNKEEIHTRCLNSDHKKPPVPRRHEIPLILNENRNFIEQNRLNALRKPALKPAKKYADSRRGDTFFLEFSGLVPKFTRKQEFGKTPKYLVLRKKDLEDSKKAFQNSNAESKLIKLSHEERDDLLEGLRANWEYLNSKYITLPLKIDTKSMKTRKLDLERQLDLLEHDIYFLEKNEENDIYILPQ